MKKTILLSSVIIMAVVLLATSLNLLQNETMADINSVEISDSIVSVTGSGSISVKPDIAYITIGVNTENKDASLAQNENSIKMNDVMKGLLSLNIDKDDIKTKNYNIYERYIYREDKTNEKVYIVTNTVEVTIRDIDKVGEVIDVSARASANQISNIRFDISNSDEIYAEALKLAMKSANIKATAIMSTFGEVPDSPSRVNENNYNYGVVKAEYDMVATEGMSATPVSSGSLTVTATVSVEYKY